DRNGILTREEIEQAVVRLKKLDRNGDGKLSPSEYEMPRGPGGERPGFPGPPR
ncbi:MAG: EF-hand domain-containing protein, partial [Planctomycetaceae bacterium]|nr:EF-hand domain-containing protein [Planctomycetaceae bacterium]